MGSAAVTRLERIIDAKTASENIHFMIVFLGQVAIRRKEYSQSKRCSWQPSIDAK
jgi:hypothetical protein